MVRVIRSADISGVDFGGGNGVDGWVFDGDEYQRPQSESVEGSRRKRAKVIEDVPAPVAKVVELGRVVPKGAIQ